MKTTTEPTALCATLGVTASVTPPRFTIDDNGWEHFLFSFTLLRNGKPIYSGTYRKGSGHVSLKEPSRAGGFGLTPYEENIFYARQKRPSCKILPSFQAELASLYNKLATSQRLTCTAGEILASLCMDAQGTDQSFADWCGDLGYDPDSRKAHGIYTTCQEIGFMLRKHFSPEELEQLTEMAHEM